MQTITFPFAFGETVRHKTTGIAGIVGAFAVYDVGDRCVCIEYADATGAARELWDDVRKFDATAAPIPPAPVSAHPGVELAA